MMMNFFKLKAGTPEIPNGFSTPKIGWLWVDVSPFFFFFGGGYFDIFRFQPGFLEDFLTAYTYIYIHWVHDCIGRFALFFIVLVCKGVGRLRELHVKIRWCMPMDLSIRKQARMQGDMFPKPVVWNPSIQSPKIKWSRSPCLALVPPGFAFKILPVPGKQPLLLISINFIPKTSNPVA